MLMAMFFRLNAAAGLPLYVQLMQQVRHAIETGALADGDLVPGIRTLATQLVVSHNTVAKAYTELARDGLLDIRHGSGAYVTTRDRIRSRGDLVRHASHRVGEFVRSLRTLGLTVEEIHRLVEAELFYANRRRARR